MKEPSEKDIKKEKQSELDKIAETNAKCVAGYQIIRNTVFNNISNGDLTKMNKYIYAEYGKVYTGLKGMIIDALNEAKDKNVKLVEKLLDESLPPAKHYEVLPKTSAFKYTNRVFTEKSVSVRSQKAADAITKIIADGRNDGLAIKDIQKKVDIVMGFRDAQGRLTDKSKKLIESGKFAHRNGSIYETYRIARTEVMRMNAFAKYDQFDELKQRYPNARLKLLATLDDRTREQSREMNGQISNAKGEFLYPDSKYYRLGTAPAQWCINDRETCTIVFLTDKEAKENREELREEREAARNINREDAQFFKDIDYQSIQDVADIQEVQKIESKIKKLGEFSGKIDLNGVPLEIAQNIYVASNKVFNRYPQIKGGVGIQLANNITNNGFADNLANITSIHLDKKLFTNSTLLTKTYNDNVARNIHPKNTTYKSLITHELGHSMQFYIERKTGIKSSSIRDNVLKRAGFNGKTANEKTKYIMNNLSIGATENSNEFFAQAFAEYLESTKPRKLAKVFGTYLFELLSTI